MDLHWHTQCEIIRVLEGEFSLILDDEKILSKAGDILFIHDGVVHGGTPLNCVYECIVFDMNLLLKKNITCTKKSCMWDSPGDPVADSDLSMLGPWM